MRRLNNCLENKKYTNVPIWFMRQAGRYLKEFQEIRKKNPNFINLCLNEKLVSKISQQPIKRFDLDAIILFSDILVVPYGLGQKVSFKKNFGGVPQEIYYHQKSERMGQSLNVPHYWSRLTGKVTYQIATVMANNSPHMVRGKANVWLKSKGRLV